jgi:hypothetical protein
VRRDVFAILLALVAIVVAGVALWRADKGAAPPKPGVLAAHCPGPDLASDTVSGCVCGAALVKVLVDLREKDGHCVPEVTPASVCVAPGGAVRFRIQNGCKSVDPGRAVVEISQPRFKPPLAAKPLVPDKKPEIFQGCSLQFQRFNEKGKDVLLCGVPEDAVEGFYKYDIGGTGIETLDPDVEVRPGGTNR